ncbi:MAG: nucleotidyltransferase family protein [bacterium]
MLTERDKELIIQFARKYDVSQIYLFGSSMKEGIKSKDIDLGVKGLRPELFFKFYGELSRKVSKNVDLVDLSQNSLFTQLIEKRGIKIYG